MNDVKGCILRHSYVNRTSITIEICQVRIKRRRLPEMWCVDFAQRKETGMSNVKRGRHKMIKGADRWLVEDEICISRSSMPRLLFECTSLLPSQLTPPPTSLSRSGLKPRCLLYLLMQAFERVARFRLLLLLTAYETLAHDRFYLTYAR